MRDTGIRSQAAPWASQQLRNALVVCCPCRRKRGQLITVRCCVTPGNGATPPKDARRKAAEAASHGPFLNHALVVGGTTLPSGGLVIVATRASSRAKASAF
jgi:hypothetical protein